MDVKSCSVQGIFSTSSVLEHDPSSFACSSATSDSSPHSSSHSNPVDLTIEMMLKFPLIEEELLRFTDLLFTTKPSRPYAFILGHGLWNDLDLAVTMKWIEGVLRRAGEKAPYLGAGPVAGEGGRGRAGGGGGGGAGGAGGGWWGKGRRGEGIWPVLFIPPNAAGIKKSDMFQVTQGDKALQVFERGITEELAKWSSDAHTNTDTDTDTDTENESFIPPHPKPEPRTTRRNNAGRRATPNPKTRTNFLGGSSRGPEIDVLGTYNMSVQADKYDGVHMDLRGNLVKAMGVLNWLSLVDLQGW